MGAELADLVVEVLHNAGSVERPSWSAGSGFLVGGPHVLTAAHNVGQGELLVRFHGREEEEYRATILKQSEVDTPDLAILRVQREGIDSPRPRYGVLDRSRARTLAGCWAVGFPRHKERSNGEKPPRRATAHADGVVPTADDLFGELLTFRVTNTPRALEGKESEWEGMSGAVVFTTDDVVVGVVIEHHLPEGESALSVAPISAIADLPDAHEWWETLLGGPVTLVQLPPPRRPSGEELRLRYQATLRRHELFGGRTGELDELDQFLTEGDSGYLFLSAPSGFGKTALLANWVHRLEERGERPCYAFLSRLTGLAEEVFTLRALCQQLEALRGEDPPIPTRPDELRAMYLRLLASPPQPGRQVVIIDGLDEASGWRWSPELFPPLPPGTFVVFSARLVADVDWLQTLRLAERDVEPIVLGTLDRDDVEALLLASGGEASVRAADAAFVTQMLTTSEGGDPIYLHYLAEDIREGKINSIEKLAQRPSGLDGYWDEWWQEVSHSIGPPVKDLLGYLLVALGPIPESELVDISEEDALDGLSFEHDVEPVRRFLAGNERGLALSHPRFHDYLLQPKKPKLSPGEQRRYRDRLIAYCADWPETRSAYALRHYLSHLAEAIDQRHEDNWRARIDRIAGVIADEEFQTRYLDVLDDLPGLSRDLEAALAHVAAAAPPRVMSIVRAALALETFRSRRFEPASVYNIAATGGVEDAERRLGLFAVEEQWAFAARLVIAWEAADAAPDDAGQLLARLTADVPSWEPIPLLTERVRRWLAGARGLEPDLPLPYPPFALPQPPSEEDAGLIVRRTGGSTDVSGFEAVERLGRPYPGHDEARAYLAERDSPALVAFATAHPDPGAGLLSDYVAIHAANPYAEYRNRSLWAILSAACAHPDPTVARDLSRRLVEAALAPSAVAFREGLGVTIAALKAAAGEARAVAHFEALKHEAVDATHRLFDRRWRSDSWGHHCRRLAALAEAEAVVFGRRDRAAELLNIARHLPRGFAGFQSSASLRLAEADRICAPDDGTAGVDDVQSALESAHNVQDPPLCAQRTARVNAMRECWWPGPIPNPRAVLERFAADPLAAEFAPLHIVGEKYERRRRDVEMLSLPDSMLAVQTLDEVADVYQVPRAALRPLNPAPGPRVRIRDSGFPPLVAARLAAEALVHPGIADDERGALIARLIPAAADSPTAADTVLSRLLLAERPSDPGTLDALAGLAPADWLQELTASAASELGPA
jgi:hypothetical protein